MCSEDAVLRPAQYYNPAEPDTLSPLCNLHSPLFLYNAFAVRQRKQFTVRRFRADFADGDFARQRIAVIKRRLRQQTADR